MDNEKTIGTEDLSEDLVVEILRYLVAHPKAKDTLNGILTWWLPGLRVTASKVEESLQLLVSKSWVIARSSPQSETIYSLNEHVINQIEEFLAKSQSKTQHER